MSYPHLFTTPGLGQLAEELDAERGRQIARWGDQRHPYLSTGCRHDRHDYCQGKEGQAGPKVPAKCKFCDAKCVCACHKEES